MSDDTITYLDIELRFSSGNVVSMTLRKDVDLIHCVDTDRLLITRHNGPESFTDLEIFRSKLDAIETTTRIEPRPASVSPDGQTKVTLDTP